MRESLLAYLCCPGCRGDLALESFEDVRGDVIEGLLACQACERLFPVVDGIPNMLPNSLEAHPAFARRHAHAIARYGWATDRSRARRFERLHARTASAFGYEWNTYQVTRREEDLITLCALTGIDPDLYRRLPFDDIFVHDPTGEEIRELDTSFLAGKSVLEVGCGMGKYLKVVSETAETTIGLDLSHSLLRARREIGDREDVHVVRGNILEPPLREGCVDFGYSVGVLHHTPDCRRAFDQSVSLVREGGHFAVWLYPSERQTTRFARAVHFVQDDLLRPLTSRMPHALLYQLCRGLGVLGRWRDAAAARGHTRRTQLYSLLAVGAHPEPEIAAFLNFDWYSPQYRSYHTEDELLEWYRDDGYTDVRILPQRTSAIARRRRLEEPPFEPAAPSVEGNLELPAEGVIDVESGQWLEVGGWAFEYAGRSPIVRAWVDGEPVADTGCAHPRL
ncbi:MAG: methyltransferase domain-containing protein, partial [Deltaproteobacteria bacterium]|nr:methyltransferase domain-containing protein [Deltaproteobacteria bacterium]